MTIIFSLLVLQIGMKKALRGDANTVRWL